MNIFIGYTSKYGFTEKVAHYLESALSSTHRVTARPLSETESLSEYDILILGGSIMMGKINRDFTAALERFSRDLSQKRLFLFISAGSPKDIQKQYNRTIPPEVLNHAEKTVHAGFGYYLSRMNFLHRLIIRMITGNRRDTEELHSRNLDTIVSAIEEKDEKQSF
ncbi:MAG: flavodoxin domain-containing protein [Fibrobacterota bacterium]